MAALVHSATSWDPFHTSDTLDMALQRSQYPESDLRSIAYSKPAALSTSPLQAPSPSSSSSHDAQSPTFSVACCSYSTVVPPLTELENGVWSNGTRLVYSPDWRPVQEYLQRAKSDMCLPPPPSDLIITLAALSVFYELSNPVHWMFWNDKNKDRTAAIVDRISLQQPALVRSKVKWNGSKEYMWILSILHGPPSYPLFEHKDWYASLGNHKPETPPRSLRKRKPKEDQEDPLTILEGEAGQEPRPKRHKSSHKKAFSTSSPSDPSNSNAPNPDELSPAATTLTIGDMSSLSPLSTFLDDISPEPLIASELPSRPKRTSNRKSRQTRTPDISTPAARDASPDTSMSSALLTPATTGQSRDRSGSQSTLVNGRRSRARSASVLSAITAVESLTQLEVGDDKSVKPELGVIDGEDQPDEEVGMVTRRRATKAKARAQAAEPTRSTKRTRKKAPSDRRANQSPLLRHA